MAKLVIEVPEEFTEVGKAMAEHLAALQRTVSRLGGGKAVDYAEIEQAMSESAGRTELAGHRAILQSLDIDVPAVIIGGLRYTRVGRCEAPFHTMVGSVSVERSLYRQSGERGGQPGGRVVDPVSLRAGVVEDGWLPGAARAVGPRSATRPPAREWSSDVCSSDLSIGRAWGAAGRPGSGSGEPAGRRGGGRLAARRGAGDGPCGAARPVAGSGSERERVWPPAVFARQFRAGGAPGRGSGRCGSPGY